MFIATESSLESSQVYSILLFSCRFDIKILPVDGQTFWIGHNSRFDFSPADNILNQNLELLADVRVRYIFHIEDMPGYMSSA